MRVSGNLAAAIFLLYFKHSCEGMPPYVMYKLCCCVGAQSPRGRQSQQRLRLCESPAQATEAPPQRCHATHFGAVMCKPKEGRKNGIQTVKAKREIQRVIELLSLLMKLLIRQLFPKSGLFSFYVCECFVCMYVCVRHVWSVHSTWWRPEKGTRSLALKLPAVVSHYIGARN